jgi:hypothetical protein
MPLNPQKITLMPIGPLQKRLMMGANLGYTTQ